MKQQCIFFSMTDKQSELDDYEKVKLEIGEMSFGKNGISSDEVGGVLALILLELRLINRNLGLRR